MLYLIFEDGDKVQIHDGFTLGRLDSCDLNLSDAKASRRHACLHMQGGVVEVEDLGSSNGTRINDRPISRQLLREGDRLQIGATVLQLWEEEEEILEFADDEVVVVPKQSLPEEPGVEPGRASTTPTPAKLARPRLMPLNKDQGNFLQDDLQQMGGWQRLLMVLLALAAAVALGYLAWLLAS